MNIKAYMLNWIRQQGKGGSPAPTSEYNALIDTSFPVSSPAYLTNQITTLANLTITGRTDMSYLFTGMYGLTTFIDCNIDTSSATNISGIFSNCRALETAIELDTSKATNMSQMFSVCTNLKNIPVYDTSKNTNFYGMFSNCSLLTDESLNNILQMCTNATSYNGTKTLKQLSLTSEQATKCTTLSNWAACQSAGWSTGY